MSVSVDASIFAETSDMLCAAADSPAPGMEMQYFMMMDNGPRRTVIATQFTGAYRTANIWQRTIFNGKWRDNSTWTPLATATSGTWTPEITDVNGHKAALSADTYGKWSLMGNIMMVTATIKVASKAELDGNGLFINGLPRGANPVYQAGMPGFWFGLSAQTSLHIQTTGGGRINIYKPDGSGGMVRLIASDITDNFSLEGLSISYMV